VKVKLKFENWFWGRDAEGRLMSEKMDGFFAEWTGKKLLSKSGKNFNPPKWFLAKLPKSPARGELWAGRGNFGLCRDWKKVQFVVWDDAKSALQTVCQSENHLHDALAKVDANGGEGLVLWDLKTGIRYKVKTMHDAEAVVCKAARNGGIRLRLASGVEFGAGIHGDYFPAIGDVVTFRYLRMSANGVPISANVWRNFHSV